MIPAEYIPLALRTESVPSWIELPQRKALRFSHAVMGLSSELPELDMAMSTSVVNGLGGVAEELGDVSWYWAVLADVVEIGIRPTGTLFTADALFASRLRELCLRADRIGLLHLLSLEVGLLTNTAKRMVFYGKDELADPRTKLRVELSWSRIGFWLQEIAQFYGATIEEVRAKNIAKLKARYPTKFEVTDAIERNLEAECRALEGATPEISGQAIMDRITDAHDEQTS